MLKPLRSEKLSVMIFGEGKISVLKALGRGKPPCYKLSEGKTSVL